MCTYIYIYMYIYMYVCIHIAIYQYVYLSLHVYVYTTRSLHAGADPIGLAKSVFQCISIISLSLYIYV